MTTTSMDLYEALVQAGVDKDKARAAAAAIVSKAEANRFVSMDQLEAVKNEVIVEIKETRASLMQWVATMLIGQAAAIISLQSLL